MSEGISLKELHKFFEYIEQAMKDNKTTVVIDNGMCRFLYTYLKELSEYNNFQDKKIDQLTNNWNELEEWIRNLYKKGYDIKLVLDKMEEIKEGK